MKRTHYSYCIFYIEHKYYKDINNELKASGYHHIRSIIPTIRFVKHISSRGEIVYQEEPLLFSYGFMKIPTKLAYNRVYLNRMKKSILGIRGWLRDNESLHRKRGKKRRVENAEDFDDFSKVAMVQRNEVRKFIEIAHTNSHLTYEDITSINKGDYIRLSSYPFIGADAIIMEVNDGLDRVKLHLYPGIDNKKFKMKIWVPKDLVVYNVYKDYNPRVSLSDQREFNMDRFPSNYMEGYIKKKNHKRNKINEI